MSTVTPTRPMASRPGAVALWLVLCATVIAPVVLNAVNLYRLSVDRLGLSGPAAYALPVTLDGAALVALILRLRALRDGDSSPGASLAVVAFAGLSAWLAGVEGWAVGGTVGALALGALPIVAVVMLDLAISSARRADLRAQGLLPGRAPVYSGLRWVLAPRSTAAAWRHGVLWENPDRLACLTATQLDAHADMARFAPADGEHRPEALGGPLSPTAIEARPAALQPPAGDPEPRTVPPSWTGSKRDLIRSVVALGVLDRAGIVTECARHGVPVSHREVTRLLAEQRAARPAPVALIHARRDTR